MTVLFPKTTGNPVMSSQCLKVLKMSSDTLSSNITRFHAQEGDRKTQQRLNLILPRKVQPTKDKDFDKRDPQRTFNRLLLISSTNLMNSLCS